MAETGEPNKQQINQHSTEGVENREAPEAGNAANAERAKFVAERAAHPGSNEVKEPADVITAVADKQTADDPTGAGPTGHGISPGDVDKETKEESEQINS